MRPRACTNALTASSRQLSRDLAVLTRTLFIQGRSVCGTARVTGTGWAMAPINPTSARAIATPTWVACCPRAMRRRTRLTPAPWRLPAEVLDGLGRWFESPWQMSTDVGGIALRPRAFDEGSTGLGMTGVGEGTLPAALTAGRMPRGCSPKHFSSGRG